MIMAIPLLIALTKKENYWLRVNRYTGYALIIFLVIVIMPYVYFKYIVA